MCEIAEIGASRSRQERPTGDSPTPVFNVDKALGTVAIGNLVAVVTMACFCVPVLANNLNHVIHVSVDGLAAGRLQELVDQDPATYPNFLRLQTEGAFTYNARSDFTHTVTVPNHASILTGRPVSQPDGMPDTIHHGYDTNSPRANDTIHQNGNPSVAYKSSTFDVAHDHGLSTSLYVTKSRLTIYARSWDVDNGGPDTIGEDNGTAKIDTAVIMHRDTAGLMDAYVSDMTTSQYSYSFIHLTDPDSAGHARKFVSPEWDDAVAVADQRLGQIFELIDGNPDLASDTAIVLTADHGGGVPPTDHTDPTAIANYTIPLFIWGPGIPTGADAYALFSNRFDPGAGRPDYGVAQQPLWDGDTANISMQLLGLEPIPGALLAPTAVPGMFGDATGVLGDFDEDGILTGHDIDLLSAEILAPTGDLGFDINGDGLVNAGDHQHWIEDSSFANTFFGDADLNRMVEFADFLALSANFGKTAGWADGDFDGNGEVEFSDFLALSANFGGSNVAAAAVPEPTGVCLVWVGLTWRLGFRSRRHRRSSLPIRA